MFTIAFANPFFFILCMLYLQGDNYFEIDVDVGSSSVARNVCGLAIGYSKAIVVDMGFCLQVTFRVCVLMHDMIWLWSLYKVAA